MGVKDLLVPDREGDTVRGLAAALGIPASTIGAIQQQYAGDLAPVIDLLQHDLADHKSKEAKMAKSNGKMDAATLFVEVPSFVMTWTNSHGPQSVTLRATTLEAAKIEAARMRGRIPPVWRQSVRLDRGPSSQVMADLGALAEAVAAGKQVTCSLKAKKFIITCVSNLHGPQTRERKTFRDAVDVAAAFRRILAGETKTGSFANTVRIIAA